MVDLQLAPALFWSLTPRLVNQLIESGRQKERRADRRAGEIAAMLANIFRDEKKRRTPWSWLDIFPEQDEHGNARSRARAREMTDEEMFAVVQRLTSASG